MQPLPLPTSYPAAPADLKAAKRELIAAREAMQGAREENLSALREWDDLAPRAVQAESAVALLKAGNKIKAADFGLAKATLPAAESARDGAEAATRELSASIEPFGRAAARRLTAALGLLESDAVTARVPDGAIRRDEARALYPWPSSWAIGSCGNCPPWWRHRGRPSTWSRGSRPARTPGTSP